MGSKRCVESNSEGCSGFIDTVAPCWGELIFQRDFKTVGADWANVLPLANGSSVAQGRLSRDPIVDAIPKISKLPGAFVVGVEVYADGPGAS